MQSFDHQLDMCIKRETTFPFCVWGVKALLSCCLLFFREKKEMLQIYIFWYLFAYWKMYNEPAKGRGAKWRRATFEITNGTCQQVCIVYIHGQGMPVGIMSLMIQSLNNFLFFSSSSFRLPRTGHHRLTRPFSPKRNWNFNLCHKRIKRQKPPSNEPFQS
jgi:hypothetical protein